MFKSLLTCICLLALALPLQAAPSTDQLLASAQQQWTEAPSEIQLEIRAEQSDRFATQIYLKTACELDFKTACKENLDE